jgi:flagellar hook-associated protein 3 FlgL
MAADVAQQGQRRALRQFTDAARVASSGMRVNAPSDDPVAWSMKVRHDAQLQRMDDRTRTLARSGGDLDTAESVLSGAADLLEQAQSLAVQAANGTLDAQSRSIMGAQVTSLRDALIAMANTRGAGGYLFGGTATGAPPVSAAGAFTGNDTAASVEVADGVTARANASGAQAFTAAGGRDVFADLQAFATALSSNNLAGIQTALTTMEAGHRQLVTAEVSTGISAERLHSAGDVTGAAMIAVSSARATETEADVTTAYSALVNTQAGYERSVTVTRQLLQLSSLTR